VDLNNRELELISLLDSNQYTEALQYIECHDELYSSSVSEVITAIMTLLIMSGAYAEALVFAESKKNICQSEDFFYNFGEILSTLKRYSEAFANYMYSYLISSDVSNKAECISKMKYLLEADANENNGEILLFYYKNDNLSIKIRKRIKFSELTRLFNHEIDSSYEDKLLEKVTFDDELNSLNSIFGMDESNYSTLLQIRYLFLISDYDQIIRVIDNFSPREKLNSALIVPLIYIGKIKKDYSYCIFYLNQIYSNHLVGTLAKINSDLVQFIFTNTTSNYIFSSEIYEKSLRKAHHTGILSTEDLKKIIKMTLPKTLILETYRGCNLKCPLCVIQGYKKFDNAMKPVYPNIIEKLLSEVTLLANVKKMYLHNLGEPLLNKNLTEIISKIKKFYPEIYISMDSNLSLKYDYENLVKSGIDEIVVALDGYDQESYSKYRVNGNYDFVEKNIQNIYELKKLNNLNKPIVIAKTVLFKHLEYRKDMLDLKVKNLNVDFYATQPPLVFHPEDLRYNYIDHNEWIDTESPNSRYRIEDRSKKLETKSHRSNICNGILSTLAPTINFDGHIFPCCVIGIDNQYSFGCLNDSTFLEVWQSDKYIDFRLNKLLGISEDNFCKFCSMS